MIPPIHSLSFLQSYICFMLIPPLPLMSIIVFHPLYFFWLFLSFLLLDYYLSLLCRLEILLNPLTCVLLCVLVSRFICFFNSVSSLHRFHNLCNLLLSIWFHSVCTASGQLPLDLPLPLISLSKPLALIPWTIPTQVLHPIGTLEPFYTHILSHLKQTFPVRLNDGSMEHIRTLVSRFVTRAQRIPPRSLQYLYAS
ncbi:hypothetical protein BDP27DRAFT_1330633 [Rhodocollybia butyracea]|uniref:Uncharacterized protein n=1 Tax=Rhodocollybia butyracea TaxID=206335 RepID=A0A9P5PIJ9_9AGAR|nr:hypothetical protein BDP27DRAFT_1330633 [Rhodocollybia butyracea]